METVGHFYLSRYSTPVLRQGLTMQDLLDENESFEDFAEAVWRDCQMYGYYNDSDLPDTISIYFAEEV